MRFALLTTFVAAVAGSRMTSSSGDALSPFFQTLIDSSLASGNALIQGVLKDASMCPFADLVSGSENGCAGGLVELSSLQSNSLTKQLLRKLEARNGGKQNLNLAGSTNQVMHSGQRFIASTFKSIGKGIDKGVIKPIDKAVVKPVVDTFEKAVSSIGEWGADTFTGKNTCGSFSYSVSNLNGLCTAVINSATITEESATTLKIQVKGSVPSISVNVGGSAQGKVAGISSPSVGITGTGTADNIAVQATATLTTTADIASLNITNFASIKNAFCVNVVVDSADIGNLDVHLNDMGVLNNMANFIVGKLHGVIMDKVEPLIKEKAAGAVNDKLKEMFGHGSC